MPCCKAAEALEQRRDQFLQAMMDEVGATAGWAIFNLTLAASMTREAAALTTRIGGEVIPSDKLGCLAMSIREPVGVVLGIAPWNAPIILGVRAIATPLASGHRGVHGQRKHRLGKIQSARKAQLHEPQAQSADDARPR